MSKFEEPEDIDELRPYMEDGDEDVEVVRNETMALLLLARGRGSIGLWTSPHLLSMAGNYFDFGWIDMAHMHEHNSRFLSHYRFNTSSLHPFEGIYPSLTSFAVLPTFFCSSRSRWT